MALNLRKRTPISYCEPEEPALDEYVYCEDCSDFVYEYCCIHGPLLVIPDDKVPTENNFPSYVPRSALTIPHVFLHLAPSIIPGAGLGVFATLTLPRGVRFGPYCGRRTRSVDSMYCWQIYDRNHKLSHVVDAGDADCSNWMRYVNCARHSREQNLVAYQYQGQLYYRTIKPIPRFTELMVFYGGEFAHILNINLSKYNIDESYQETIVSASTHVVEVTEENDSTGTVNETELHCDETPSCFSDEKFEFINDEIGDKCNRARDKSVDHNDVGSKQTDNFIIHTSKTITYVSGKIQIKFTNDTCRLHECGICQKSFASNKNLRRHLLIHSAVRKYACSECNFTTNHKKTLDRHSFTHSRLYKCRLCTYETDLLNDYDKHVCSKRSKNSSNYVIEKKCQFCDFVTSSRKKLYIHVSKHKGNVFKCDLCDYSSYCKYNLARHLKRHKF